MTLPIPPEPEQSKLDKWAKGYLEGISRLEEEEVERRLKEGIGYTLKKGIFKNGTGPASYLWEEWGPKIQTKIRWPQFIKKCHENYRVFLSWSEGKKSWEAAIKSLCKNLNLTEK